jgi:hypothetical protein
MNATCRQLEFVGPSQGENFAERINQKREIRFFSAGSTVIPNGALESDSLRWEMAAWRAAERREQAVVARDPWEELVYALLAAAGLVGIVLGSFGVLDAVSPSPTKAPHNVREVVGYPVPVQENGLPPEGQIPPHHAEL